MLLFEREEQIKMRKYEIKLKVNPLKIMFDYISITININRPISPFTRPI